MGGSEGGQDFWRTSGEPLGGRAATLGSSVALGIADSESTIISRRTVLNQCIKCFDKSVRKTMYYYISFYLRLSVQILAPVGEKDLTLASYKFEMGSIIVLP